MDPLPPLAEDVSKEDIISSLCQQMLPNGGDENIGSSGRMIGEHVDFHRFNENNMNALFYSLLLGLIELAILEPGKESVQSLRMDLMKYLREHSDEEYDGKSLKSHAISRLSDPHPNTDLVDTDSDSDSDANMDTNEEENADGDANINANEGESRRSKRLNQDSEAETNKRQRIMSYYSLSDYTKFMENVTGEKLFHGSELEIYLLSKVKNVSIELYEKDGEDLVLVKSFYAVPPQSRTIHLLRCSVPITGTSLLEHKYVYTLFTPKTRMVKDHLQSFNVNDLRMLYGMVSKSLVDRNGWVVDFNPLLTSLLGCNSNLLHLGSTEQSKAALFYIGPYINKDGVKITDALPLLLKAHEHALNFPSVADDSGTDKRTTQHTLTRALNRMNNMVEVTDTQAAAGLLGMGASLCSERFVVCDTDAYNKFVTGEIERTKNKLSCCGFDTSSDDETECSKVYYDEGDILEDDGDCNSNEENEVESSFCPNYNCNEEDEQAAAGDNHVYTETGSLVSW